ncbi:Hypothetical protein CINCED_3A005887 [Cinara cedri]|uniref:DUF4371 domain-containing protein n=1 Tax=Cinara cedri TaxID=506608 RepID=A0A5E4M331_9HEMI|nr:Hypothetical protein CINCED_3A005887 [Cinara cedri]
MNKVDAEIHSEEFIIGEVDKHNISASNLIFYNVPKSNSDNEFDRVTHDINLVNKIIHSIVSSNSVTPFKIIRLGVRSQNNHRPIKTIFNTPDHVFEILPIKKKCLLQPPSTIGISSDRAIHQKVQKTGVATLHKYVKTDNKNATEASFLLSYRITHDGKPHTIVEGLTKPCMTEIVSCVLVEDAVKKVKAVQCSNNVISDRIHKISDHIPDELICRLTNSKIFAIRYRIQLDESTDVIGLSILLIFVKHSFR